jgi:mRNA interferase MazF
MNIRRGDIYWIEQPIDSLDIPHPHVVVQDDIFNQSRIATVVVCALTSNLDRAKDLGNVLLNPSEANLIRQSVVVSSKIASIPKAQLGELMALCLLTE